MSCQVHSCVSHVHSIPTHIHGQFVQCIYMQALRPGAATALDAATLEAIAGDVPSAALDRSQVVDQLLVQVMVATELQPNKSASRRMIKVRLSNVWYHLSHLLRISYLIPCQAVPKVGGFARWFCRFCLMVFRGSSIM